MVGPFRPLVLSLLSLISRNSPKMARPNDLDSEQSTCRHCLRASELKVSHIIPKFIIRWLKETSATGYLRSGQEMQRRQQDGRKRPMLCTDCEQLLSSWERQFADRLFTPLKQGEGLAEAVCYDSWLPKFAASLSWRALIDLQSLGSPNHVHAKVMPKVYEAAEVWRRYLLNQREFISPFDQHLIPLGFIDSHTMPELPPNINRYLGRSIGFDLVSSHDQTFMFTKLPFAVIIGVIQTLKPEEWVGTRLTPSGGVFGQSKKIGLPGGLLIYMNGQSKRMMELNQTLSQTQKSIVHESVKKDVERAANPASFEVMLHDIDIFGDDAFERGNQTGPPRHFFLSFLGFFIVTNYRTYALYLLSTTKATTHLVKRCEHVPKRFSFPPNAELAIRPSPPILMRWPWATRPVLMGETRVHYTLR